MNYSTKQAVDFLGYEIALIEDGDGNMYVPLKRVCEILGIDHKWQIKSVKRYGIYDERVLPVLSKNGRHRKMLCLPVKRMRSWMRGVNHSKVRADMVERLFEWRDEFDTAMDHLVCYGILIDPLIPAEQLEAANRDLLEKRTESLLSQLPDQRRQYELLHMELVLLEKVRYESRRYKDKIRECVTIALGDYEECWSILKETLQWPPNY